MDFIKSFYRAFGRQHLFGKFISKYWKFVVSNEILNISNTLKHFGFEHAWKCCKWERTIVAQIPLNARFKITFITAFVGRKI